MMAGMVDLSILVRPARWGVRVRSAVISTLVLAVVFGIGVLVSLWLTYRSLTGSVDALAATRADELVEELRQRTPAQLDAGLFEVDETLAVVQILDADGNVVRASAGKKASKPLVEPGAAAVTVVDLDDDERVTTRPVANGDSTFTVVVAVSDEQVEDTVRNVGLVLAVVAPAVLLASAAATYRLVGGSLASVEAIRRQVAAIGADRLGARVPVPDTRDEIARLAVMMNAMLDRIQAGGAAQRRFVADASHELRSPLTTVIAALELGREHPEFLDANTITSSVLPEAQRIRDLVEDMLTLAASDEHGLTVAAIDVDVDDLVADTAATVRHQHPNLLVEARIAPARVVGDPRALQRLIRNLADNAAAHAHSRVLLAVQDGADSVRLVVDDDGPGIPAADRTRVFERFVRLQSDRGRESGGTGLGLAIVAEIVRAHAGVVTIEDSPWGGARIVVRIPKEFGGQARSDRR